MKQLALHLQPAAASLKPEDFLVSAANRDAHALMLDVERWNATYALLTGPEGSGKTHLAALWAGRTAAPMLPAAALNEEFIREWSRAAAPLVIDDVRSGISETLLFHLLNLSKETGARLLLTGREGFPAAVALPDLRSRLLAAPQARLEPPDEELLRALFVKHFSDRQLQVSPDILQYLVNHVERSGKAVCETVRVLDEHALEKKQKISLPFVRNYLAGRHGDVRK